MKTFRPVKTNKQTQKFGDSLACIAVNEYGLPIRPFKVLPGTYPNMCPIGSTKFYPAIGLQGHNGDDFACWYREPVYHDSEFDGWVQTGVDQDGGVGVDIVSYEPLMDCSECGQKHYVKRRYWHFYRVTVHDGQRVRVGDQIGEGDSTGASSGNHVHAAWKWCNKDGSGIHEGNGYFGAFTCPGFMNEFVLDYIARIAEWNAKNAVALKQYEEAEKIRSEIRTQQLTVLQLMTKLLFLISEEIKKLRR